MDLVWQILVGGAVGWIAGLVMKTGKQMGLLATIVVGMLGAALAAGLAPRLGLIPYGLLGHFLVALGGAILVIAILRGVKVLK